MPFPISLPRFAVVWVALAVAMSANGIARELLLTDLMSRRGADIVSALLGIALITFITRRGYRGAFPQGTSFGQLLTLSMSLIVLTVVFETVLGLLVDRKSWAEIGGHYALWRGELWPLVLLWLGLTPFVWSRQ